MASFAVMTKIDPAMQALDIELSQMAGWVEVQLASALEVIERRDIAASQRLVEADERIDRAQMEIDTRVQEALCLGPSDEARVRELLMMVKVAGELERVGDLAKNIAKRNIVIAQERVERAPAGLVSMGRTALRQFSSVLNAYTARNVEAAKAVWSGDDTLDALYYSVFHETVTKMMKDPSRSGEDTHLIFIAKNFERVGDHATNIAEALYYFVTGARLDLDRPKGDDVTVSVSLPPVDSQ